MTKIIELKNKIKVLEKEIEEVVLKEIEKTDGYEKKLKLIVDNEIFEIDGCIQEPFYELNSKLFKIVKSKFICIDDQCIQGRYARHTTVTWRRLY